MIILAAMIIDVILDTREFISSMKVEKLHPIVKWAYSIIRLLFLRLSRRSFVDAMVFLCFIETNRGKTY